MIWKTLAVWSICVALFLPHSARAQWEVIDPANIFQATISAANSVKIAANTAQALIVDYNILKKNLEMLIYMAENLQRLPEGLNFVDTLLAYGNRITGLLTQATALGYDLQRAQQQFDQLYQQTANTATATAWFQDALRARQQAAGVAVQVQSIQTDLGGMFARICALLNGSWTAHGALDTVQVTHQQQALGLATQQQIQALLATQGRLQAQQAAEDVQVQRLRLQRMEEFTAPLAEYAGGGGWLPTLSWTPPAPR